MPQYYQLLKPRLNLGPSATANDYAKYLVRILVLLKSVRVSNGIHTRAYSFFLKKYGKNFKGKLRPLTFFCIVGSKTPHNKNYIIVNTIIFKTLCYIEPEAFSEHN